MEEWQRDYIRKQLPELTKATKFRQSLLDKLTAKGVIGDEYVDQLKREGFSDYTRTSELYDLLKTRDKGFQALSNALLSDNQTGAYRILQKGLVAQKGTLSDELNSIPLFTSILPAIDALLDDDNVNVLVVSTPDVSLSLKRITDVGPDYLLMHDHKKTRLSKKTLQSMEEETALVVPCDKQQLEANLTRVAGSAANVVLLTSETEQEIEQAIMSCGQTEFRVVKEDICWTDLTPQAQAFILQQRVKFQNQIIHLKQIPAEIFPTDEMKGQIMFELLNGMCPELVKNSVPSSPKYYVPRRIASRVSVSPEVFQNAGKDVFVVKGLELYQLTNLTRNQNGEVVPVARSSEQAAAKSLTAQFIQLEHDKDYEDICRLSKNPVHLVSYQSGALTWRKSHNSLGCIQNYIHDVQENVENEDNFVQSCLVSESPVCIADSPGMGKTVLLSRLAEKVMSESASENCVVKFLVLRDLTLHAQSQGDMDVELVCELVAKSSSDYPLGRQIVIKALKSEKIKCHVFLDGYDELLSSQLNTVNQLLDCLRNMRNTQVYVTTRLNRCHELEKALTTLGFHVKPFAEDDQLKFLTGYWNDTGAESNDKLEEFAKSCLNRLKKGTTETERDIAGVPLQCRLLAELYTTKAHRFCEGREVVLERDSVSSVFEMFQSFTEISFAKVEATLRKQVVCAHIYYAIKLLFPEIGQEFKMAFRKENLTLEESALLAPGILEKLEYETDFRFIHRTLAEFMVAHFVNEFLEPAKEPDWTDAVGVVLPKLLATNTREDILLRLTVPVPNVPIKSQAFEYSVICYFLNSFMLNNNSVATDAGSPYFSNTISTLELSDIFTAAVASNFPAIAAFLTRSRNFKTKILPWSNLFLLAAKYAGTELLCQLTTLARQQDVRISERVYPVARTIWKKVDLMVTPLHVAVHWGNYNVTLLLLNNHGFHEPLVQENSKIQYLLHTCVMESYYDAEQVVADKTQIIKFLCSQEETAGSSPYRHVLEGRLPDGSTPLLEKGVHPKLIQCLVQVGADINAVNDKNECVLHTVIYSRGRIIPTQFHELVESLTQTPFQHFDLKSDDFGSPLKSAIRWFDIEMRTVDLLLERGADINHIDELGGSILLYALIGRRPKEFVHQLAARGANLTNGINERRVVIPAKVMEAVEYVIETTPSTVSAFAQKKLYPDSHEQQHLEGIINANVELQEMEKHQLSPFLLSLHNPSSIPNNPVEPCFILHSLNSRVIGMRWKSEEHGSWGLAFNYNQIQRDNLLEDVAASTTKVVLMNQALIDEIGKVFEETDKCTIVGIKEIQFNDLPKRTQQLICSKKLEVPGQPDEFDAWNGDFPKEQIRGKLLFDLTIEHRITLINRDKSFSLDESECINLNYKMSGRRNISTRVFDGSVDDVFVIQGANLQQLSRLTQGMLVDKSSNQMLLLIARCIQLEYKDDFERICSLSKSPVHLLSYHKGMLTWVKSHGSLAVIQQHIHKQQQKFSLPRFLGELTTQARPTCLAYNGSWPEQKSAILSLREQICQNQRSSVFCLKINNEFVMNMNASVGPVNPIQFVAEMLSDYAHGRELVVNCLQAAEYTVHLIFYRRINFRVNQYEMPAIRKILCHTEPLRNIKLHFIVRINELSQMEEALQTLGYNFVMTKSRTETVPERVVDDIKIISHESSKIQQNLQAVKNERDNVESEGKTINLIISGLTDSENEKPNQIKARVQELVNNITNSTIKIDVVQRIGRFRNTTAARAVRVTFENMTCRNLVWSARKDAPKPVFINEDLPESTRKAHFLLRKKARELRDKNIEHKINYSKLSVTAGNETFTLEDNLKFTVQSTPMETEEHLVEVDNQNAAHIPNTSHNPITPNSSKVTRFRYFRFNYIWYTCTR